MSGTLEHIKPADRESAFSEVITYRTVSKSAVIAFILAIVSLLALQGLSWRLVDVDIVKR